jgi:hypothetical protein
MIRIERCRKSSYEKLETPPSPTTLHFSLTSSYYVATKPSRREIQIWTWMATWISMSPMRKKRKIWPCPWISMMPMKRSWKKRRSAKRRRPSESDCALPFRGLAPGDDLSPALSPCPCPCRGLFLGLYWKPRDGPVWEGSFFCALHRLYHGPSPVYAPCRGLCCLCLCYGPGLCPGLYLLVCPLLKERIVSLLAQVHMDLAPCFCPGPSSVALRIDRNRPVLRQEGRNKMQPHQTQILALQAHPAPAPVPVPW